MKKIIAISVILILVVLYFGTVWGAQSVTVNNTTTNPVPVAGSVGILGTPNVNVANPVSVTGSVSITGTPSITTTPQTTTKLVSVDQTPLNIGNLDTSNCSAIRIDVINLDPGNALHITINELLFLPQRAVTFPILELTVQFGVISFGNIIDFPPPAVQVLSAGTSNFILNLFCR